METKGMTFRRRRVCHQAVQLAFIHLDEVHRFVISDLVAPNNSPIWLQHGRQGDAEPHIPAA